MKSKLHTAILILSILVVCLIEIQCEYIAGEKEEQEEMFSLSNVAYNLVKEAKPNRISPRSIVKAKMNVSKMKVGIVGAGLCGMYAALLLQDLGIKYEILESSNRIGGRLKTVYFNESSEYNYAEMGGMRFPKNSAFERLNGKEKWSLINYLNSKVKPDKKLKIIPFHMKHPNNIYYFNGKRKFRSEVETSGDLFGFSQKAGGFLDEKYARKNADYWEARSYDYIQKYFNRSYSEGYKFLMENDYQTYRSFLMNPKYPEFHYPCEVVDWMEDMGGRSGGYSFSFMDAFLDAIMFDSKFITIDGGVSRISDAMNSLLKSPPKLNTFVKGVNNTKNLILDTNRGTFKYTHVIMTPQLSVLRDINFECGLTLKKRFSMRLAKYSGAVKVALQFKTRFWENAELMDGKPIFGGQTTTDLTIRRVIYPSYGINCSSCLGTLLVSYSLFRDADRYAGITDENLAKICLRELAEIHGDVVNEQYTGKYDVMDWSYYEWTQGSFATFEPGYFTSYYPYLIAPEVNNTLLFAGDSLSVHHGWSIGSLVSGFRAVSDLLASNGLKEEVNKLHLNWGNIDEPDFTDY